MAHLLRMPEIAANSTEAVLQSWTIAEGTAFNATDIIAAIETEKALVDLEAEFAGVLVKTLVENGASVEVGQPIALIAEQGESVADINAVLADLGVTATAGGTAGATARETVEATSSVVNENSDTSFGTHGERIFASPIARKLARDAGVDIESLAGTGPRGRIVRKDVEAAIASPLAASTPAVRDTPAPVSRNAPRAVGSFAEVPHSRMRKAIAARLTQSKQTIPHFYLRATARVTQLVKLRESANVGRDPRLSLNDFLIKAVAAAHIASPGMNVTWGDDSLRVYGDVDIAVAIATEGGLVTPVVRSANTLTVSEISATVRDFAERARKGQLKQDELEGGSVSVTNLGMFGTEEFAAIINPPQSAIVAIGAVRQEPVVQDGQLVVGDVLHVTLSVDHRPIDGVVAAKWMKTFVEILENPVHMLV